MIVVGSERRRRNDEEGNDGDGESGGGTDGGPHRDRRQLDLDLTTNFGRKKRGNIIYGK